MMKSNRVRIAVLLGSFSVIGLIVFQLYWVNQTFSVHEQQFNRTITVALYNVAEKMAEFNGTQMPNENPVHQITSNYFIVNINDIIDAKILDHFLKSEFEYRNLKLDYEYAIYDCESNDMVYGNYISSKDNSNGVTKRFPRYSEYTYYFGIYFPSRTSYILENMNVWYISSFIILTAVLFFSFAVFIILKQKRLSEIQKDFINNMTHEIRTPVSTIGIVASVLEDPGIVNQPERFKQYRLILQAQYKRLLAQTETILQNAHIDRRRNLIQPELFDVMPVITDIAEYARHNLYKTSDEFIVDLPDEKIIIRADRIHFANVLYNLLDNAFKYSPEKKHILLQARISNNELSLIVADNGIGIEKKYHQKIFGRFFRIPTGDIHNVKGFGLGLHYVRAIVRKHRWKIRLDSELGKGSVFKLIIPVASEK